MFFTKIAAGDRTTIDRTSPVQIKQNTKFTTIVAAGWLHSLAIDENGNLWAWGRNDYSALGDGTSTLRNSPVQIKSGTKFTKVAAGWGYSLAIDVSGNLWAWGRNDYCQLGVGTAPFRSSPIKIKVIKR